VALRVYHQLYPIPVVGGELYVKAGARGYPDPLYRFVAQHLKAQGDTALDLNPGVGVAGLALVQQGMRVDFQETSRAALRCLEASFAGQRRAKVERGLPWEVRQETYDQTVLVLPAYRGNRYVELALIGASRALKAGGTLWLAGDKHKGFERYFKRAKALLGSGEIVERQAGLRLATLTKTQPAPEIGETWTGFKVGARGHSLVCSSLAGVFSAGELDPASGLLLECLGEVGGAKVLDLGAGYGAMGLVLAAEGATVSLCEDDWPSVLSAQVSARNAALQAEIWHCDVDDMLEEGMCYDIVVANPPFHVGGQVILEVARAFVHAAQARLNRGGRFLLVANAFLAYEPLLQECFGSFRYRQPQAQRSYKVFECVRR
jgi:16S rRNA (guanine1207-N2)-methyltransferase